MAFIQAFGRYLPERVLSNADVARLAGCEPAWIAEVSGIEERRVAREEETVADLAVRAARDCLSRAARPAASIGLLIVASGSFEGRFPGPAAAVAHALGLASVPVLDLPMASAGSLVGLALAHRLSPVYGTTLVIGAEKMSSLAFREPVDRNIAILFGDGAGACLVGPETGLAAILDSDLHTDGSFAGALRCGPDGRLAMDGRTVILQAARKLPDSIHRLLEKHAVPVDTVGAFLLHQANLNLALRVARALGVGPERFFSNIRSYGNTSSASMLIAASEWSQTAGFQAGVPVVFAAFGAGFYWGSLLATGCA